MKDYYKILRVPRDASTEQIEAIFRRLALIYHPDVALIDKKFATEQFMLLKEAYDVLVDPARRAQYDSQYDPSFDTQDEAQVKPPVPRSSRRRINFGSLPIGVRRQEVFRLDNVGGPARSIDFDTSDSDFWLEVIPILQDEFRFPVDVMVRVDTSDLSEGSSYRGFITVGLDGHKARIEISVTITLSDTATRIFTFESGDVASSPVDLVPLCMKFWVEACKYLYDDAFFKHWLIALRRNDIIAELETSRLESNRNVGLDKFLRALDPSILDPELIIEAENTKFGAEGIFRDAREAEVRLQNKGPGWCYGTFDIDHASWLALSQQEFVLPPNGTLLLKLTAVAYQLVWKGRYETALTIQSNATGRVHKIQLHLDVQE